MLKVIHPYQADSDVELTLAVGDYVVIRKVCFAYSTSASIIFILPLRRTIFYFVCLAGDQQRMGRR